MSKRLHILSGAAIGSGVGFGAGAAVGAYLDAANGRNHGAAAVEADINKYQKDVIEYEALGEQLEVVYGGACLSALASYQNDGPLSDVPEDSVVSDLLAKPTHPCGEDATDVRIIVKDVKSVKNALIDMRAENINEKYKKLDSINANNREDDKYRGWLVVGRFVASFGGFLAVDDTKAALTAPKTRKRAGL